MSQTTLNGSITPVKVPETKLEPNEKKILNCVRHHPGTTLDDIQKKWMIGSGITLFDNRLRALRKKGYIVTDDRLGLTRYWSKEAVEGAV